MNLRRHFMILILLLVSCKFFIFSIIAAPAQTSGRVFYARKILASINVNYPEHILGEPDGKLAEIKPGGELTVLMEEPIVYNTASDDGFVVVQGDTAYGLAGFFRMNEEGKIAWQPLSPGSMKNGFKLGADLFLSFQRTNTIKIVNDDGNRSLLVDAIAGLASDHKQTLYKRHSNH